MYKETSDIPPAGNRKRFINSVILKMPKRFEYYYLPEEYHAAHDYCEFVVLQIEEFITDKKFQHLRQQEIKLSKYHNKELSKYKGHIFDFFNARGLQRELNLVVANRLLNSLLMETCYFLQEAYLCTLKMRLSVAFTLFRKPFSEILIIYMRLLLDKDFLDNFNNTDSFNPIAIPNAKKKEYLHSLNDLLFELYDVQDLYDYLFDKSNSSNLYNISNHAIHLYTDKNPVIKTEKQNLNFIFGQKDDILSQWEYIYTIMPMLLTFLADVTELCVMAYTNVPEDIFKARFQDRYKKKRELGIE